MALNLTFWYVFLNFFDFFLFATVSLFPCLTWTFPFFSFQGGLGTFVDSSISTFTNHGCNGTYTSVAVNLWNKEDRKEYFSEWTADENVYPWTESGFKKMFNPLIDRHLEAVWTKNQVTRRDIRAGEEITENYLFFLQRGSDWADDIQEIRQMCMGMKGVVAEKESIDL